MPDPITYGSVCSGIEAPSSAWHPLGWKPLWFSEIEPFPKAVLAHHYPNVPDLGDMTALPGRILAGEVPAPDVFVGGTPCQSFSVAGLRQGLKDPRGQLTRTFVEILDALDTVRAAAGKPPAVALWENVPGVLSDKDNAYGNFLAALVGEDDALLPPGGKWANAGFVFGPQRIAAWRVLDAQYFGVAQRRRRVFVVVSSRAGSVYPPKVLLVEPGVRRDTPPSREAWQGTASVAARGAEGGGGGRGAGHDGGRGGGVVCVTGDRTHALTASGDGATEDGTGRGTPIVVAPPLTATNDPSRSPQSAEVTAQVEAVLRAQYPLAAAAHPPAIVFTGDGIVAEPISTHEHKTYTHEGTTFRLHNCVSQPPVSMRESGPGYWLEDEVSGTLDANMGMSGHANRVATLAQPPTMAVRRLTPVECERLQGFPDNHTLISWKGKPPEQCPDGPRYRALGNSMAVPVIRWIGRKLNEELNKE